MAWAGSQGQSPSWQQTVSSCFMTSCIARGLQGLQGLARCRPEDTRRPSPNSFSQPGWVGEWDSKTFTSQPQAHYHIHTIGGAVINRKRALMNTYRGCDREKSHFMNCPPGVTVPSESRGCLKSQCSGVGSGEPQRKSSLKASS